MHKQRQRGGGDGALQDQTDVIEPDTGEDGLTVAAGANEGAKRSGTHVDDRRGFYSRENGAGGQW